MYLNVKNVLFLTHGVMTKTRNWTDRFEKKIESDPEFSNWVVEKGEWGYLFFLFSIFPFFKKNKKFLIQKRLKEIQDLYPNAKLHVIAHSYGTMLIDNAMKNTDIVFDKVIYVGGIVNEKQDFSVLKNKFSKIYNFCSYKDWVIKFQPIFGKCGYFGFVHSRKIRRGKPQTEPIYQENVHNFVNKVSHSQYFTENDPNFYDIWKNILLDE